jgi:hypothetical protein
VESYGRGIVMMWAAISNDSKTELVHVLGNLTAVRYRDKTNELFHFCVTASITLRNMAF